MDVEGLTYNYGTTRDWIREILGELLGTFLLVFIGNCAIAQAVLSRNLYGNMLTINLSYGLAYMIGILVAGGASGGHVNPAVTLAFALIGRLPCRKICYYFAGQYVGAFIAAFFTYAVYSDAIYNFDSGDRQITGDNATAGIFATFPRDDINKGVLFLDQVQVHILDCTFGASYWSSFRSPYLRILYRNTFTRFGRLTDEVLLVGTREDKLQKGESIVSIQDCGKNRVVIREQYEQTFLTRLQKQLFNFLT